MDFNMIVVTIFKALKKLNAFSGLFTFKLMMKLILKKNLRF